MQTRIYTALEGCCQLLIDVKVAVFKTAGPKERGSSHGFSPVEAELAVTQPTSSGGRSIL